MSDNIELVELNDDYATQVILVLQERRDRLGERES